MTLCRLSKAIASLSEFLEYARNFNTYAAEVAQRPMTDTVLMCRWLDGGGCRHKRLASDIGVHCYRIGGLNHINASYISRFKFTLRS